ncbi:hypothetical protein ACFWSJ_32360 [Streptomyces niveus]|uniref:hypothetical protein n=1 Tax=Streptomyces niveus TaxID=193462 RepID=UPI00364C6D78
MTVDEHEQHGCAGDEYADGHGIDEVVMVPSADRSSSFGWCCNHLAGRLEPAAIGKGQ